MISSKSSKHQKRMNQTGKGKPKRNRKHPFDNKEVLSSDSYDRDIRAEYAKYGTPLKYLSISGYRESLDAPGTYRKVKQTGSE